VTVQITRAVLTALLIGPVWIQAAGSELKVRVSPRRALAPADVAVTVTLDPREDSRLLEVVVESALFYEASAIDLDGARGPHVRDVRFRQLPAGDYEIRVLVRDAEGHERAWARRFMSVS
jgi:hypothetical protein